MAAQIFPFGTALTVVWHLTKPDGTSFSLNGYSYRVYYRTGNKETEVTSSNLSASGNTLSVVIPAQEPTAPGEYAMRLVIFQNGNLFCKLTYNDAFVLSSQMAESPAVQAQEPAGNIVHLYTVAEFYLLAPVVPVVGEDGFWWVNGARIVTPDGENVPADHTVRYDSTTKYLIIDEGRVDASGQSIQQTITDVADALADWESRYAVAEGSEDESEAGDGSRWGSFKAADASRQEYETSRQQAEGQGDYSSDPNSRRVKESARQTAETARQKAEGQLGNSDPDYASSRIKKELDRQKAEGQLGSGDADYANSRIKKEIDRQTAEGTPEDDPDDPTVLTRWAQYKRAVAATEAANTATDRANTAAAAAEHQVDVKRGYGIDSVTEPVVSTVNGGTNTIRVTTEDGKTFDFYVRNGKSSAGFFATASALSTAISSPNVGDYAFVSVAGDGTWPAYVYICSTAGTWTATENEFTPDDPTDVLDVLNSTSTTAALSANQGKVLDGKISQLGQKVCDIYFSDNTSPKFANNGTSVDITFTGNVLLIYNDRSNVQINTGTHTFSLTNAQKLVYLNNALTVESVTTLDNGIVIAINSGGSISGGLLAPYYAAYDIKNKEFTVIFSDDIYPNIAKIGTDLVVSFTTATNIIIRQPNGTMLIINHGAGTFTIAKNKKLVYDTALRVVAYNVDNGIVLAVNNGDGYFTSGLLAESFNAVISKNDDYDLINKAFSVFYSDGSYPTVSTIGDSLIVSFANSSTIGFYQNNGKRLLMNHGADSFTIGKNQKLVYDSILKVVAYDYNTGIVLAFNGGDGYFTSGLLADSLNALISRNIGQSEYLGDFCDNIISVARCGYNISSLTTPPEQTIASYKEAYKNKYRYMLADVQFTSDHVPVALHDETINSVARNADGTTIADPVYLADLTLEQVDEYDFGIIKGAQYAGTKIMRIDDFIKWCKMANCVPILEVKTFLPNRQDANFLALAAIIKKYAMGEKTIFEADAGHTTAVTLHEGFPLAEIGRTCTANTDFSALVTQTLAVKGDNKVFWYLYLGNQTTGQISNNMISLATANGISIGCSELFTESDLNSFLTDANNLICEKVAIRNHPVSYYMI